MKLVIEYVDGSAIIKDVPSADWYTVHQLMLAYRFDKIKYWNIVGEEETPGSVEVRYDVLGEAVLVGPSIYYLSGRGVKYVLPGVYRLYKKVNTMWVFIKSVDLLRRTSVEITV